jgi:hypothetical protein
MLVNKYFINIRLKEKTHMQNSKRLKIRKSRSSKKKKKKQQNISKISLKND